MTVSNTQTSITLPGNGVQTVFTYPFEIPYQDGGSLPAAIVSTLIAGVTVVNPSYSITGVGSPSGGTVIYTGGGTPLPVGGFITITRAKALTQPYSFTNQGFIPSNVELALDNLTLEMQQLQAAATAFQMPVLSGAPSGAGIGSIYFDLTLGYPRIYGTDGQWHGLRLT